MTTPYQDKDKSTDKYKIDIVKFYDKEIVRVDIYKCVEYN
jgi:hypothetical protein